MLKTRFRCLLGARQLHYKPSKATKIANVCVTLHNICIEYGVGTHSEDVSEDISEGNVEIGHDTQNTLNVEASEIRDQIKSSFN